MSPCASRTAFNISYLFISLFILQELQCVCLHVQQIKIEKWEYKNNKVSTKCPEG